MLRDRGNVLKIANDKITVLAHKAKASQKVQGEAASIGNARLCELHASLLVDREPSKASFVAKKN